MTEINSIRLAVNNYFPSVKDLGEGLLKCTKDHNGSSFLIAYIDLSDKVVEKADNLQRFQERILGADFFSTDSDQRWNNYMYFWAGPHSRKQSRFDAVKSYIENDRHFARKFVLDGESFLRRFEKFTDLQSNTPGIGDIAAQWETILVEESLPDVLGFPTKTKFIESIANGTAFRSKPQVDPSPRDSTEDILGKARLRRISLNGFRNAGCTDPIELGGVNLLVGPNGVGKTSLLEAIEALYCGGLHRASKDDLSKIRCDISLPDGTERTVDCKVPVPKLKQLNELWYSQSHAHSNAITRSFNRFNFLDTDAAFRLSIEDTSEIRRYLRSLVVGPETSRLWTYIDGLTQDVVKAASDASNRVNALAEDVKSVTENIERLRSVPSDVSVAMKSYTASLQDLGATWRVDAESPLDPSERRKLERISKSIAQAIAIIPTEKKTLRTLAEYHQSLSQTLTSLQGIASEYTTTHIEIQKSRKQIEDLRRSITLLEGWINYCERGIPGLLASIEQSKVDVSAARKSLGSTINAPRIELPLDYDSLPLAEALSTSSAALTDLEQQTLTAEQNLKQGERFGQSLAALRVDLVKISRDIITHSGDSTHCPICLYEYEESELRDKIDAITEQDKAPLIDGLRHSLSIARERLDRAREYVTVIRSLQEYSSSDNTPKQEVVRDIRARVQAQANSLSLATAHLKQLQSAAEGSGIVGDGITAYEHIRDQVARMMNAPVSGAPLEQSLVYIKSRQSELEALQNSLNSHHSRVKDLSDTAATNIVSIDDYHPQMTPPEILASLKNKMELASESLEVVNEVADQITVSSNRSLDTLQHSIDATLVAFDKAEHSRASLLTSSTDLASNLARLETLSSQYDLVSSQKDYLIRAANTLTKVVTKHSIDKATQDALTAIRTQVDKIFARIHSPEEYELGEFEKGEFLRSKSDHSPRSPDEVSTGQRAALALSIFLALNRCAGAGPRVVLIDDPVAHVDDLNMLSFLDYLRELHLTDNKQIFFATADTRLAALFQKKFDFLGKEQFRTIRLSR